MQGLFPPFPKVVGLVGMLTTIYGALDTAGVFAALPPKWAAILGAIGGILAYFSHSATGTGGKPPAEPFLTDPHA